MRFGCCVPFDGTDDDLARVELLAEIGYQFFEPPVSALRVEQDPEEWYAVRRAFHRAALKPEAFNCFLPGDLQLVGDEVDWPRLEKYVALALDRAEEAGAQVIVFGSGGSRNVPEGYPHEEALHQVRYFLNMTADYAGELRIGVESLRSKQCNMLNRVEEVSQLVREVGRPEIGVTADCFHMDYEEEPWSNVVAAADLLAHAHCCDRDQQLPGRGGADLTGFFDALREAGYDGRVSLECPLSDFEPDVRAALEHMQEQVAVKR